MKIHEYQAKECFSQFGIPISDGITVSSPEDACKAAAAMPFPIVLKAQVHVGGRGKAGGVKLVQKPADVSGVAKAILGLTIKGLPVRKLLVTQAIEIATEVYLSLLLDRSTRKLVFIGCADGGIEIEETAKSSPEKILRYECAVSDLSQLSDDTLLPFARRLFSDLDEASQTVMLMQGMARMFLETDASLIEINPLIADTTGKVFALDAKVTFDDNALFRHEALESLRDMDAEDQDELDANAQGLSFIRLDGNIGCMVNGAGLAMATMDITKHFGGEPANFLDVGGSSDPAKVVTAFKLILKDPAVKVILVNIFGGITRCDDIAKGILASLEQMEMPVPIVIRLIGTNQEEGRALLADSDLITVNTLEEGAQKAAALANR